MDCLIMQDESCNGESEQTQTLIEKVSRYQQIEAIQNACLQIIQSAAAPDEALQNVMKYIGEAFQCERVYIFEFREKAMADNTCEWCK